MKIELKPIGVVHSPYKSREDVLHRVSSTVCEIEVFEEFEEGLKDVEGFSYLIILWIFHKSKGYSLHVKPLVYKGLRGVFATRHPNRPNPIGFTVVELLERKGNILQVRGVDMIDGTPVVDIKPYTSRDRKENIRIGWLEKETRIKKRNERKENPLNFQKLSALIIYWSGTGNTEKVANAIRKGMEREGLKPIMKRVEEAGEEELYDYDLIFLGSPSHAWLPAEPVLEFVKNRRREYARRGRIKPCAPKIPGKNAVVFCTYSGPHTGIDEAIPVGKYMRQFFEHLGFDVKGEWYIVGEFHGHELLSTKGKLGDIRRRPNSQDLSKVENDTAKLIRKLMQQTI